MSENQFEDYLKEKAGAYEVPPQEELFDRIFAQSQSPGKLEKELSTAAAGYRVTPDTSVWSNISRALGHTSYRRWISWGIAASLVLGTGTSLLFINNNNTGTVANSVTPATIAPESISEPAGPSKEQNQENTPAQENNINTAAPGKSTIGNQHPASSGKGIKSGIKAPKSQASPAPAQQQAADNKAIAGAGYSGNSVLLNQHNYEPVPLQNMLPFTVMPVETTQETPIAAIVKDTVQPGVNPPSVKKAPARWDIAAYYTPQFGSWHLYGDKYQNSSNYVQARNKFDRSEYCYAGGIEIGYRIGDHLRLFGGLQYQHFTSKELTLSYNNSFSPSTIAVDPHMQSLDPNAAGSLNYVKNSYEFIQIPIGIEWITTSRNTKWNFGAGLRAGPQYLVHSKSYVFKKATNSYTEMDGKNNVDIRDLNFTAGFRLVSQFNINNKVGLYLSPEFSYALRSNFSENYIVSAHPFSIGVQSGIRIKF